MPEKSTRIYLDYASSAPVLAQALSAMHDAESLIGNPGAIHAEGVAAKRCLEDARECIAGELACKPRQIVFTSGLTEANNLAVLGCARQRAIEERLAGSHWIVSSIEHDAVLESFAEVERLGGVVTHIDPNERGIVTPEAVMKAIRPETVFVSIGWANNEIGVVQPIRDIGRAITEQNPGITFHSDAGQAPLYRHPHVHTLGVDLLCLGSNKLYGPHGIGALYVSNDTDLRSVILGGKQERRLRAGTENVALATGFATALVAIGVDRKSEAHRIEALRDLLFEKIASELPDCIRNGDRDVLPHLLNISIPSVSSEYVTLSADASGLAISTKSACREGEESRSHVVHALGGPPWRASNSFRFSLGRQTTHADIDRAATIFVDALRLSRSHISSQSR